MDITVTSMPNSHGELVELGKPLMQAAQMGDVAAVVKLLRLGAPFGTDWLGMTPLHHAAAKGHRDMVDLLIRAGITKEPRSKVEKTPLHLACQEGHTEVVRHLISNGAEVDATDMIKMTPLHWAVQMNHVDIVNLLLFNGADPHLLNKFDKNCFDISESSQNETMSLLLKNADKNYNTLGARLIIKPAMDSGKKKIYIRHSKPALMKKSLPQKDQENMEVWQYLEDHGIEMLEGEDVNLVAAAIGSGQSVYVTEAGKQALHLTGRRKNVELEELDETSSSTRPGSKRPLSQDSEHYDRFVKINAKYMEARKNASNYRNLYVRQKQIVAMYKKQLVKIFQTIKSKNRLEVDMQCDDDEDEEDDGEDDDEDDEYFEETDEEVQKEFVMPVT